MCLAIGGAPCNCSFKNVRPDFQKTAANAIRSVIEQSSKHPMYIREYTLYSPSPYNITLICDASFNNKADPSGLGVVLLADEKFIIMAGYNANICSSSLHAEATSLLMALETCREKSIKAKNYSNGLPKPYRCPQQGATYHHL